MKIKKYLLITFIAILGLVLPMGVRAAENNQMICLTLQCEIAEMEISLYKIADVSDDGTIEFQKPFDSYKTKVKGLTELSTLDSEGWRKLAGTLENNVLADSVPAMAVKKTSTDGSLTFENLSQGLYLLVGTKTNDDKYSYTASPMILSLPAEKESSEELDYQPMIRYTKIEKEELKTEKNLAVIKIWKDSQNKEKRPKEITVEILKNGKTYDTVKLNEKNQWKYQWENLSAEAQWTVVEKNIPDSYRVEYSKNGNKIYIVNHSEASEKEETSKPEKLPQTGQLWWPVPVLVLAGLTAFEIGMLKKKG